MKLTVDTELANEKVDDLDVEDVETAHSGTFLLPTSRLESALEADAPGAKRRRWLLALAAVAVLVAGATWALLRRSKSIYGPYADHLQAPKQPYDVLGQDADPSLERVQAAIRALSASEAALYDSLSDAVAHDATRWHVEGCGSMAQVAVENQNQTLRPKIVNDMEMSILPVGLADRMKGIVTSFSVALVLGSPFYIAWQPNFTLPAEASLESPYIDWAASSDPAIAASTDVAYMRSFSEARLSTMDELFLADAQSKEEIASVFTPKEVNYFAGNAAHVHEALLNRTNSWFADGLRSIGLSSENIYRCILDFLFWPLEETRHAMAPYQAVLEHPSVFSIAVQIRVGDDAMDKGEQITDVDGISHFLQCAADFAAWRATAQHKLVVFYVASSDPSLQKVLKAEPERATALIDWQHPTLPMPLILVGPSLPTHIRDDSQHADPKTEQGRRAIQHSFQYAVFENYLMDSADGHVICSMSGYGLLSALRTWDRQSHDSTFLLPPPGHASQLHRRERIFEGRCSGKSSTLEDLLYGWGFG